MKTSFASQWWCYLIYIYCDIIAIQQQQLKIYIKKSEIIILKKYQRYNIQNMDNLIKKYIKYFYEQHHNYINLTCLLKFEIFTYIDYIIHRILLLL